MRPPVRLAAGAAALACLLGPAGAALADKPDDPDHRDGGAPPSAERPGDRERGGGSDDNGGTPAPPETIVPVPPPQLEAEPRRERRERSPRPERRDSPPRGTPAPASPELDPQRLGSEPGTSAAPAGGEARGQRTSTRREANPAACSRSIERGERLLTLSALCGGESGERSAPPAAARTASAVGTVRNLALVGALALLSVAGLRILALRSRDPS